MVHNKKQLPLNEEEIQKRLKSKLIAKKIYAFGQLSSTNSYAKRLAQEGVPEGSLIISDQQTKGRGRLGRSWESPPGKGLWFSLILRPDISIDKAGIISLLAGVSIAEAVEKITNLIPILKWPNDLLINSKKFCGALIETEIESRRLSFIILGIGINVNQSEVDFSEEIRNYATSLQIESKGSIDRLNLLVEVLHFLEKQYLEFKTGKISMILDAWKRRCPYLNKKLIIRQNAREIEGIFEDLDEGGRLLLRLAHGEIKQFSVGDTSLKIEKN